MFVRTVCNCHDTCSSELQPKQSSMHMCLQDYATTTVSYLYIRRAALKFQKYAVTKPSQKLLRSNYVLSMFYLHK